MSHLVAPPLVCSLQALPTTLPARVIALLQASGAQHTPHTGRSLLAHLHGTYLLLQQWGNSDAVCLAGLFHSIYGTNAFAHQSLLASQRAELCAASGAEAEALAWLFCSIDRPHAILQSLQQSHADQAVSVKARRYAGEALATSHLSVSHQQLQALAEIECANLIEQGSWSTALRELYCAALDGSANLSSGALAALRTGWAQSLDKGQGAKPGQTATTPRLAAS